MPDFKLPLSGDVTQAINPLSIFFNPLGSQIGLININLGTSSNPPVEQQVLTDVASYGKQLGRIEDALAVLIEHFRPERPLEKHETDAIDAVKRMIKEIDGVKNRHSASKTKAE